MEFLNNELLNEDRVNKFRNEFNNGTPYKHIIIENFLNENKAKELFQELKKEKFIEKECDLFSFSQTVDFSNLTKGILKDFYKFFRSKNFLEWLKKCVVSDLGGEVDMSGTLYKSCDYLLCHDDRLEERKIAFIYYLSENFSLEDGGSFLMYEDDEGIPGKVVNKYKPLWNSLILFEVSEKSFHEVEENVSKKDRYAIGGWFH
jgi:prolyl 3-hydroxylase /prolyl 3,4-dihydroxylase